MEKEKDKRKDEEKGKGQIGGAGPNISAVELEWRRRSPQCLSKVQLPDFLSATSISSPITVLKKYLI